MIYFKTDEEIELMREANQLVGKTLGELAKHVKPGISTLQLDKVAEEFIRDNGAVPAFLGYGGFPNSICTSVNEQVVHGIPSSKAILKEGDIVSIDCGTVLNGFVGDSAYTFCVGEVADSVKQLLKVTKDALYLGIKAALDGRRLGDVSNAVQSYCESHNYSVVRELVGHGIGRKMHEEPEVPNYGRRGCGPLLKSAFMKTILYTKSISFLPTRTWTSFRTICSQSSPPTCLIFSFSTAKKSVIFLQQETTVTISKMRF